MAKATYRAATGALVTTGTVSKTFFALIGSATRKVTVTRFRISGATLTAVAYNAIKVVKNSTASASPDNTLTCVPLNSAFTAATAAAFSWTSDQTAGTPVGIIDVYRQLLQATTAAAGGYPDNLILSYGDTPAGRIDSPMYDVNTSGIVLNGVAEECALQWNASAASAVTLAVSIEWIEETN
jgi:hypothetical protein